MLEAGVGRKIFRPDRNRRPAPPRRRDRLRTAGVGDPADAQLSLGLATFLCVLCVAPAWRLLFPRRPHVLRAYAFERQHLKIVGAREFHHLVRRKSRSGPSVILNTATL